MKLSDFFIPVLAYVRAVEESPSSNAEETSKHLNALIATAKNSALSADFSINDFQSGLFPVVAWTDERMSTLRHGESPLIWQRYLLQRQYFKTTVAGIEFFQRLEALDKQEEGVRELYLLCLCMGYLGRFSTDPNSIELSNLIIKQYYLLNDSDNLLSANDNPLLFPFAYKLNPSKRAMHPTTRRLWSRFKTFCIIIIPPLLIVLLMLVLDQNLSESVNQFYQLISK